nr:reverse transcriptase domain-containing protein [Tanacetum cinerariifolium]
GVAYEGPSIPIPKKIVERETEEITDKEKTNLEGSTAHIQPPVTSIFEPDVSKTLPKPNIPYPLRLNDQKLHEKATNQMEKFFQIFQDVHFDISFADALLLMPKFASTIKSLLTNKDKLFELAKIHLNENCSAMLLKKLPKKLGDPSKFLIPYVSREKYAQEILGFSKNSLGGNPTLTSEPILSDSSLSLTPFEGSDFILEKIEAYLKDESISPEIDHADCDLEEDICLIEKLLNDDLFQLPLIDLKQGEVVKEKSSIEEPPKLEKLNDVTRKDHFPLPFMDQMLERLARNEFYCFLDGFYGYFQIPINPPDQENTTFTCPYGTFAYRRMPFGLCNAPGTFQRCMMTIFHDIIEKNIEVFMDDFSVFGDSFSSCLSHLDTMLQRCEDTNLVLN